MCLVSQPCMCMSYLPIHFFSLVTSLFFKVLWKTLPLYNMLNFTWIILFLSNCQKMIQFFSSAISYQFATCTFMILLSKSPTLSQINYLKKSIRVPKVDLLLSVNTLLLYILLVTDKLTLEIDFNLLNQANCYNWNSLSTIGKLYKIKSTGAIRFYIPMYKITLDLFFSSMWIHLVNTKISDFTMQCHNDDNLSPEW